MRLKRKIPEINSSSSADIAFLLLIFFLLTTSMEKEKSLSHSLPEKKDETLNPKEIKERDVFEITIQADNSILYHDEEIEPENIKELAEIFIANPYENINLPEKFETDIPSFGKRRITQNHLFLIQISPKAEYQTYIDVQSQILAAYNKLRNELSIQKWGKKYMDLPQEQQAVVLQIYPYKLSEAELKEGNNS